MEKQITPSVSDQFITSCEKQVPHHDATPNHERFLNEVKREAQEKRDLKAFRKGKTNLVVFKTTGESAGVPISIQPHVS